MFSENSYSNIVKRERVESVCVCVGGGWGEVGWVNAVEFKEIKFCSSISKTDKTTTQRMQLRTIYMHAIS